MRQRAKPKALGPAAIVTRLKNSLAGWRHEDGCLKRTYETNGWKATVLVVNAIAHLAEVAWHHPEILASYARVEVRLSTHEANGVSERDFELAHKIEEVILWRPGRDGGALEGTPEGDPQHAYLKYED